MSIKVVLLAAGLSKRMGGINKLLTPVNGKPLILYSVENALNYSSCVYVVTGHEREKVENILSSYPVNIIYNQAYHEGQETSLKTALNAVDGPLIVMPSDMPFITKNDFERCEKELDGYECARAFYNREAGHPVALSRSFVEIYRSDTTHRVRTLSKLVSHNFYIAGPASIMDVDTQDDLKKTESMLKKENMK